MARKKYVARAPSPAQPGERHNASLRESVWIRRRIGSTIPHPFRHEQDGPRRPHNRRWRAPKKVPPKHSPALRELPNSLESVSKLHGRSQFQFHAYDMHAEQRTRPYPTRFHRQIVLNPFSPKPALPNCRPRAQEMLAGPAHSNKAEGSCSRTSRPPRSLPSGTR